MSSVTFYAYALTGAPTVAARGWFVAPALDHLLAVRARTALGRAVGSRVSIFRCHGVLEEVGVLCEEANRLFDGEVDEILWWFTLYCARSVAAKWEPPACVREYLHTGLLDLRAAAHKAAWTASLGLDGTARLAARVAMYAADAEHPLLATREACRLAGQIADDLRIAVTHQERALASALLGLVPSARERSTLDTLRAA